MWIREENHFTDFFFISRNGRWDLKVVKAIARNLNR